MIETDRHPLSLFRLAQNGSIYAALQLASARTHAHTYAHVSHACTRVTHTHTHMSHTTNDAHQFELAGGKGGSHHSTDAFPGGTASEEQAILNGRRNRARRYKLVKTNRRNASLDTVHSSNNDDDKHIEEFSGKIVGGSGGWWGEGGEGAGSC